MLRYREFDVAEMSLSSYTVSTFLEPQPFIAIPVFPSRYFRHSSIFISAKSGIREPKDLIGKRIGTPEFQMTAPVWIRGILAGEYGVAHDSVEYWTGGEEVPEREEKLKLNLPPTIRIRPIGTQQTLSQMLADGEIDALHSARVPSTMHTRPATVKRLFEDFVGVERDYYRKTRIFPIMHTIVIRRDIYERSPWVAQSLYKAFAESQHKTYTTLPRLRLLRQCYRGLLRTWMNCSANSERIGGPMDSPRTVMSWIRFYAITTSRDFRSGGSRQKNSSPLKHSKPSRFDRRTVNPEQVSVQSLRAAPCAHVDLPRSNCCNSEHGLKASVDRNIYQ